MWWQCYLGILSRYRTNYNNGKITTEIIIYCSMMNLINSISCFSNCVCIQSPSMAQVIFITRGLLTLFLHGIPAKQAHIKLLYT